MLKIIAVALFSLTCLHIQAQEDITENVIREKANQIVVEHIGDCLFTSFLEYNEFKKLSPKTLSGKENNFLFEVSYKLVVFDSIADVVSIRFNSDLSNYQLRNIPLVKEEIRTADDCAMISTGEFTNLLATFKKKNVRLKSILISEYGIAATYRYNPQTVNACIGSLLVNLHSGAVEKDYVNCPNF